MEKKEYISGDLYKMTRNNADFKPLAAEKNKPAQSGNTLSAAQERRLSDVYNAKLDLMARIERTKSALTLMNEKNAAAAAKRQEVIDLLKEKSKKLEDLIEPENGRALHEYLREVEHLRMEFFRMETELESLNSDSGTAVVKRGFFAELSEMKATQLLKLSFCGLLPLILTLLTSALIIAAAILFAWKI